MDFGSNNVRRSSRTASSQYPLSIGLKKMEYGWVLRTNISGRKEIKLGDPRDFSNPQEFRIELASGEATIGNGESLPLFEVYEAAASQPCISVTVENGFVPESWSMQTSSLHLGVSQDVRLNDPPSDEPTLRVDKPWYEE